MNINDVIKALKEYDGEEITLMEVCGTLSASISENAIPSLISDKIHLISGPGCPVCVTVSDYVDKLIELALDGNVIVTFGDMIRVPGSKKALKDKSLRVPTSEWYIPRRKRLNLQKQNRTKILCLRLWDLKPPRRYMHCCLTKS